MQGKPIALGPYPRSLNERLFSERASSDTGTFMYRFIWLAIKLDTRNTILEIVGWDICNTSPTTSYKVKAILFVCHLHLSY